MLNEVLTFLKSSLNDHLRVKGTSHEPQEDQVVFLAGSSADSLGLKLGTVSALLVRIEQEKVLRAADLYQRTMPDGTIQNAAPEIRLELFVLFVAHYSQYEDALRKLSAIIAYFQDHRLITAESAPDLSENIQQLVIELVTLTFAEQNEIWGSLRLPYHPSVLYKVKMVVFRADAKAATAAVSEPVIEVRG
jgi:hypothetical protein